MLPVSYNTFGFTAIILMVIVLVISEVVKHVRASKKSISHKVNKS
jgi:hypothetical protein